MNTKKFIFVLIIFSISTDYCKSQNNITAKDTSYKRKNAVYFEVLGNALFYSINYERKIKKNKYGFSTFRIGISDFDDLFFPLTINEIFDNDKKNHFEVGTGITFAVSQRTWTLDRNFITANIMYRYQKPNGKFMFRAGWTPLYFYEENLLPYSLIWFGTSIGYVF